MALGGAKARIADTKATRMKALGDEPIVGEDGLKRVELEFARARHRHWAARKNPGFFTTISSNGKRDSIIWALSHPQNTTGSPLTLYAFGLKTTGIETLFNGTAGAWPNLGGNSNLVPVVANGQVFVASNKQLQIFGLLPASPNPQLSSTPATPAAAPGGAGTDPRP